MNNYKLTIQYDGTNYNGWQVQENSASIQQKITESIEVILKKKVSLIGSGRTDTGVHAFGQVANFRTDNDVDIFKFMHSLNSILPSDISIVNLEAVPLEFHARFDAKKRTYLYFFSSQKSPFYNKYSYFYHGELNCELLNELSGNILGEKDFTSFARQNTGTKNKICNIYEARWKKWNNRIIFKIEADRFLHGMVRTIVGTLIKAAKTGGGSEYVKRVIESKDRRSAGEAVPAKGLFLYKVKY